MRFRDITGAQAGLRKQAIAMPAAGARFLAQGAGHVAKKSPGTIAGKAMKAPFKATGKAMAAPFKAMGNRVAKNFKSNPIQTSLEVGGGALAAPALASATMRKGKSDYESFKPEALNRSRFTG